MKPLTIAVYAKADKEGRLIEALRFDPPNCDVTLTLRELGLYGFDCLNLWVLPLVEKQ